MKKKVFVLTLAIFTCMPTIIKDLTSEYTCLKKQYPLLRQEWFLMIQTECSKYKDIKIEPYEICAIIEHEGKWNPNITHKNIYDNVVVSIDYGLMQINSCHSRTPEEYLNPKKNIEKGVYEYYLCLIKSKGNKEIANRYYNAGRNNKPEKYNNWKYVKKISCDRNQSCEIEESSYQIK